MGYAAVSAATSTVSFVATNTLTVASSSAHVAYHVAADAFAKVTGREITNGAASFGQNHSHRPLYPAPGPAASTITSLAGHQSKLEWPSFYPQATEVRRTQRGEGEGVAGKGDAETKAMRGGEGLYYGSSP